MGSDMNSAVLGAGIMGPAMEDISAARPALGAPAGQRPAYKGRAAMTAQVIPPPRIAPLADSKIAEERPLVCVVDDAQWLDNASALALAFVARRLLAESIGLVFSGLPELVVGGPSERDARALLDSVLLVMPLVNRFERSFVRRLESLPAPTRRLLLIAAEPQPTPGRGRFGSMCVPSRALRMT